MQAITINRYRVVRIIILIIIFLIFGVWQQLSPEVFRATSELGLALASPNERDTQPKDQTKDLTFYLHYVNASETAKPLPGGGSTLTYFDTTQDWNDVNVTYIVTVAEVNFDWYLSPPLAGEFTVTGVAFKIWSRYVSGAAPTANVDVSIIELDSTGTETWGEDFFHDTVTFTVTPELKVFSGTLTSPHTFEAGSSIKIRFRFNPGTGKTFEFYYDTAQMNSRVEFTTPEAIKVRDVYTLDYLDVPQVNFDMTATHQYIKFRTTIIDPFGGYDIRMVNLTLRDPGGNVILEGIGMNKINGTPISYENVYELIWNYSGYSPGEYNITIWTVDNNGIYYYETYYDYGPYAEVGYGNFWLGGLPVDFYVTTYDSRGAPLAGAMVSAVAGGKMIACAYTDSGGTAKLQVVEATYDLQVTWEEIIVGIREDYTVTEGGATTIDCDVFYPTFEVVDDLQHPLGGAAVYLTHPNGTYNPVPKKTDPAGRFTLDRAPIGYWHLLVRWCDVAVFDALVFVDFNGEDKIEELRCAVFSVEFEAVDIEGEPLIGAQLVVANATSALVADSQITDINGKITSSLPVGTYDVSVYWHENNVGRIDNYFVCRNEARTIECEVYYVHVQTVDSQSIAVGNTQVIVTSPSTGSVLESVKTNLTGDATLRLPTGTHRIDVYWEDILVNTSQIEVTIATLDLRIQCDIYHITLTILDSQEVALPDASITIRAVASGKVVDTGILDSTGKFKTRLPQGDYEIQVYWVGVEVKTEHLSVTTDITSTIYANVYYLELYAVDARGVPVSNGTVVVSVRGLQEDKLIQSAILNATGTVKLRVPSVELSIKIYWREREVYHEISYMPVGDAVLRANCSIYYLTIIAVDVDELPLENARITLMYHAENEVYDSGLTGTTGKMTSRLPLGNYDLLIYWQAVLVYELTNYSITNNTELYADCHVYYLTIHAVDVDNKPIECAQITILFTTTGQVYDTKLSGEDGTITTRLPTSAYDIVIYWRGAIVYEKHNYSVTVDSKKLTAVTYVYYLTVKAVGNDGNAIPNVEILIKSVDGASSDANGLVVDAKFTDRKGKTIFRLPRGEYKIYGYFKTTYQLTEVNTKVSKNITFIESTTVTLTFDAYPPAYTSTVAFSLILTALLIILIVIIVLLVLFLRRRRRRREGVVEDMSKNEKAALEEQIHWHE